VARRRLGRDDWADAALAALAEGGLAAVAVEPLATRLGATKGSFYWHFANRDELVAAALDRWADRHTEAIIRELEPVIDPIERLDRLFDRILGSGQGRELPGRPSPGGVRPGESRPWQVNRAELALLAHADDPAVAAVLSRTTARRVEFIAAGYREAGWPAIESRHRAVLAYTAYIGLLQAQRASGGTLVPDADRARYLAFLRRAIRR
jgi:AcrR family transcriptional regulator